QSFGQVLPNGGGPATDPHILPASGALRLLERRADAVGHEVEHRAPFHYQGRPRVMGEHEDRRVIGRVLTPPAAPALVGPGSAHGAEHVAAEDVGTEVLEAAQREVVIDPGFPALQALHLPPDPGGEEPRHQLRTADAKGVLETLVGTGTEAVD